MPKQRFTTAKLAAEEKGCTPAAIYAAADRGVLNDVRMGGTRLIVMDAKYSKYSVSATGGRAHKRYLENKSPGP